MLVIYADALEAQHAVGVAARPPPAGLHGC